MTRRDHDINKLEYLHTLWRRATVLIATNEMLIGNGNGLFGLLDENVID